MSGERTGVDSPVQRRRKPKSEPKNIFNKGSGGRSSKPSPSPRRQESRKTSAPTRTPTPPPKPAPLPPKPTTVSAPAPVPVVTPPNVVEAPVVEETEEVEKEEILEEQLLGTPKRRSRGLQPVQESDSESTVEQSSRTSSKAMEIIEASKARATASIADNKKLKAAIPVKAPPPKNRPRRRPKPSFQPAARERRMDRSRHMEYKYEVRGLLEEINVAEEHRSSLLGTIWAKGERQTSADARQYIHEKEAEGIIDSNQAERLLSVVDNYTIRR